MVADAERDDAWFEREYNPRVTVANFEELFAGWVAGSAAMRARHAPEVLRYGQHAREEIDIFRPANPRGQKACGMLVFIHGGYWRAMSKAEHSFVAGPWVDDGYSVAVINYPLCPEVRVIDIAAACRAACAALWRAMGEAERGNAIVAGHSAGGYLTAAMMATDWQGLGLPAQPFRGGLSLSGVFGLEPLLRTSMNQLIKLTAEDARDWSLTFQKPRLTAPMLLAVGGDEPASFHDQSAALAKAWSLEDGAIASIPGRNHFTIVEDLAKVGTATHAMARGLLKG